MQEVDARAHFLVLIGSSETVFLRVCIIRKFLISSFEPFLWSHNLQKTDAVVFFFIPETDIPFVFHSATPGWGGNTVNFDKLFKKIIYKIKQSRSSPTLWLTLTVTYL